MEEDVEKADDVDSTEPTTSTDNLHTRCGRVDVSYNEKDETACRTKRLQRRARWTPLPWILPLEEPPRSSQHRLVVSLTIEFYLFLPAAVALVQYALEKVVLVRSFRLACQQPPGFGYFQCERSKKTIFINCWNQLTFLPRTGRISLWQKRTCSILRSWCGWMQSFRNWAKSTLAQPKRPMRLETLLAKTYIVSVVSHFSVVALPISEKLGSKCRKISARTNATAIF